MPETLNAETESRVEAWQMVVEQQIWPSFERARAQIIEEWQSLATELAHPLGFTTERVDSIITHFQSLKADFIRESHDTITGLTTQFGPRVGTALSVIDHNLESLFNFPINVVNWERSSLAQGSAVDPETLRVTEQAIRTYGERQHEELRRIFEAHTSSSTYSRLIEVAAERSLAKFLPDQQRRITVNLEPIARPTDITRIPDADVVKDTVEELVTNAAKNMLDRGVGQSITVSVKLGDARVVIRISDDGPGIPDQIRARLFNEIVTTNALGIGSGEGLLKNKHRLEEAIPGATLTLMPASNEPGTTFMVTVPTKPVRLAEPRSSIAA